MEKHIMTRGAKKGFRHPPGLKRKRYAEVLALVTKEPQTGRQIANKGKALGIYNSPSPYYRYLEMFLIEGKVKCQKFGSQTIWSR